MDKVAEQSAPQESEVRNEGARSKNYMARFLTQTAEAFDTTRPFLLGSPEPLGITPDKLQILDRYTLDYATNYWIQGDRKAMTHEQKLQEFASKWANAITKRYALPKEGEAVRLDDLEDRKKKREVLRKLGLDPQNMSADAVRKYHDENFAKGRDVNGFIGRVRQSLSPEEMRTHLDDIEFVAGMFDRGTAKDIRALIELELEQNKDEYAKRANDQGTIRSDEEKRRLQELSKYLKPGNNDGVIKVDIESVLEDPQKSVTADDIEITGKEDKPTVEINDADLKPKPVLEVDVPAAQSGQGDLSRQIEIVDGAEADSALANYTPTSYDSYSNMLNMAAIVEKNSSGFNKDSLDLDLLSPRSSIQRNINGKRDSLNLALLDFVGAPDMNTEVEFLMLYHDLIQGELQSNLKDVADPKEAFRLVLMGLPDVIHLETVDIKPNLLITYLQGDKLLLGRKGNMSAVVNRGGNAFTLDVGTNISEYRYGKGAPEGDSGVLCEHQLRDDDGDIIVAGTNFWDAFQDRYEVFKLIAKFREENPDISDAEIAKQLADVVSNRGVAGEFNFVILKRASHPEIKFAEVA